MICSKGAYLTFTNEFFPSPCPISELKLLRLLLFLGMFQIQTSRRALESFFVHKFTDRKVSYVNCLLAPAFYVFANLSPTVELLYCNNCDSWYLYNFTTLVGLVLFFYSSLHQYRCHRILASLREGKTESLFAIPHSDWFEYVSCPHYLAEVLIYLSLLLILGHFENWSMWLILAFVLANLGNSALDTHRWYKNKFGDDYPKYRKAIIPNML